MINYILLVSRQGQSDRLSPSFEEAIRFFLGLGKVRLAKWFTTMAPKAKAKIVKDVTQLVLARRTRMCNFLEYKGASLSGVFTRSPVDLLHTSDQTQKLYTEDTPLCSSSVELDLRTTSW